MGGIRIIDPDVPERSVKGVSRSVVSTEAKNVERSSTNHFDGAHQGRTQALAAKRSAHVKATDAANPPICCERINVQSAYPSHPIGEPRDEERLAWLIEAIDASFIVVNQSIEGLKPVGSGVSMQTAQIVDIIQLSDQLGGGDSCGKSSGSEHDSMVSTSLNS